MQTNLQEVLSKLKDMFLSTTKIYEKINNTVLELEEKIQEIKLNAVQLETDAKIVGQSLNPSNFSEQFNVYEQLQTILRNQSGLVILCIRHVWIFKNTLKNLQIHKESKTLRRFLTK